MSSARRVEFHPEALREARAARDWYGSHDPRAGQEFGEEIDRAIERIATDPGTWPRHSTGTRRFLLRRFPFLVIYRELGTRIQIVAVAHGRRRPGYWKSR